MKEAAATILKHSAEEHEAKIAEENRRGVKQFETVKFGEYKQNSSDVKEDIEWLIIERKNGYMLLLSKYLLDSKKYYENFEPITWENSDIRNWLNTEFYNSAFSSIEKQKGYYLLLLIIDQILNMGLFQVIKRLIGFSF